MTLLPTKPNQTRPNPSNAPQPRKGTTTERSPTRDQNIQNSDVDCVWCGFWLTRNENTSRKKSNIYKGGGRGEIPSGLQVHWNGCKHDELHMAKNELQLGDTWGDLKMSFNTYEDDFNVQEINKTVHLY